ncbi:MAG: conjugal transfer protein TraD [Rhodospirillaceae bacterium]|nr:conjugal transfer protein TraD [Rhodospirillaceae bacterium]
MADQTKIPGMTPEEANWAITRQISEVASAGVVVSVDPDDADMMAAFEDDALSPEDALESRFDDVVEDE